MCVCVCAFVCLPAYHLSFALARARIIKYIYIGMSKLFRFFILNMCVVVYILISRRSSLHLYLSLIRSLASIVGRFLQIKFFFYNNNIIKIIFFFLPHSLFPPIIRLLSNGRENALHSRNMIEDKIFLSSSLLTCHRARFSVSVPRGEQRRYERCGMRRYILILHHFLNYLLLYNMVREKVVSTLSKKFLLSLHSTLSRFNKAQGFSCSGVSGIKGCNLLRNTHTHTHISKCLFVVLNAILPERRLRESVNFILYSVQKRGREKAPARGEVKCN